MTASRLLQQIARKDSGKERIADRVIKNPKLLSEIFNGLSADNTRIKYGCVKVLRIISKKDPKLLYPKFDFFVGLLDSENKIMQWEGIHVLANLAGVDSKGKFEKIFNKYFAPITGSVMVTAANVIKGAAKIALAKPKLTEKISRQLLKVEQAGYKTAECRNVALGHAIKSFDQFFDQIKNKQLVLRLVKKQLRNTRNATRKSAERFLARHQT
jgi:hypothetical protein